MLTKDKQRNHVVVIHLHLHVQIRHTSPAGILLVRDPPDKIHLLRIRYIPLCRHHLVEHRTNILRDILCNYLDQQQIEIDHWNK